MTATTRMSEDTGTPSALYVALELGQKQWNVGTTIAPGARPRTKTIAAGDLTALSQELARARTRWGVSADGPVYCCYEAGRDGFWLHRWLLTQQVTNVVVDAASIEVPRRARRAKTDRLDLEGLLSLLMRWVGGDRRCCRMVRVPTAAEEDARQVGRALAAAKEERTRVRNRLPALLTALGLRIPIAGDLLTQLPTLPLWDGSAVPAGALERARADWERLQLVDQQIGRLTQQRLTRGCAATTPGHEQVAQLLRLKAIGPAAATTFVQEVFGWRQLRNRREVGAIFGLTPTPWRRGTIVREQGISKTGNRQLRALAIEIAWLWRRWQPASTLTLWFEAQYGKASGRQRRIGIVALARRLMIALWRFVSTGEIPEGAELKWVGAR